MLFPSPACVSCDSSGEWETVPVALGVPLTLHCTYNCSSGFVQGQWKSAGQVVGCPSCHTMSGDLCTLPLLVNATMLSSQTPLNYSCQSCQTDQALVPCRTERRVVLKISISVKGRSFTIFIHFNQLPLLADEYKVAMVLAVFTLVVVVVLTSCLCFLRYRGKCAGMTSSGIYFSISHCRPGSDKDYASVTFTNTDCQSDHEVPYAEIMISVPGVSTPELRALPSGPPGPPRPVSSTSTHSTLRWREDSGLGPLQHAFRSADRLHVQPRDVCRKMSSTSEYAIITYSSDALH
ncbi:hypothetical protein ACEWY4_018719 [Coilia grayii]|uniref:Uncharacterized protein n=1 Tax=Coilia grayii TaxID=363190 RepID=A0ABD1JE11_9TELE